MDQYDQIAPWYDRLQSSVDHEAWADFLAMIDQRHGKSDRSGDGHDGKPLLLDLGCGTGRNAFAMEKRGYDVIGIDRSEMMLMAARDEAEAIGSGALFLQQDICDFELFGTVDLAVCLLDTINHITRKDQIRKLFSLCANYLNQGSLLILDIGTDKHFGHTLGNNVFYQDVAETADEPAFTMLWQNHWQSGRGISNSEITVFAETDNGLYERYDDVVRERYYDWRQLRDIAADEGLKLVARYGELADRKPNRNDERIFLVFVQPFAKKTYIEKDN